MFLNSIFNWSNFFSFLIGLGAGLVIFALIYLLMVLMSINKNKHIIRSRVSDVSDEEIKAIIKASQDAFKDNDLKGAEATFNYCTSLGKDLVIHIASRFFPNSKHPVFEISIDELIILCGYISNRVDEILGRRGLRMLRKIKLSTIVGLTDTKKMIEEHPIVKTTKKYKIYETLAAAKKVINVVNPVWWARKLITDSIFGILINKLCLVILGIIGEETYRIYSKSVFNSDVELDSGINEIIEDIDNDISSSLNEEDRKEYLAQVNELKVKNEKEIPNKKGLFGWFSKKGE